MGVTEAKYIALLEGLLEVPLVWQMQEFMVPELYSRQNHEVSLRRSKTEKLQEIYRV